MFLLMALKNGFVLFGSAQLPAVLVTHKLWQYHHMFAVA
jgi:hypothetical protein